MGLLSSSSSKTNLTSNLTEVVTENQGGDAEGGGVSLTGSNLSATVTDFGTVQSSFEFAEQALNRGFDFLQTTLANTSESFADAVGIGAKAAAGADIERVTSQSTERNVKNIVYGLVAITAAWVVFKK